MHGMFDRQEAWILLAEHTQSDSLRKHCLGVEACMKWYANRLQEDENLWRCTGLLHDFDYEAHPDEHPQWGMNLLQNLGWPSELIQAIGGHADYTGIPRTTELAKYLFACDEISGFVTAVTYVRPSKSIFEVEVKSVLKKLKTASFAAGVSRDDVLMGAQEIGISLEEHIGNILTAMRESADELGLRGSLVRH